MGGVLVVGVLCTQVTIYTDNQSCLHSLQFKGTTSPNLHVFGLCKETRAPRINPHILDTRRIYKLLIKVLLFPLPPLGCVLMLTHFQWWGRLASSWGYHTVQPSRTPQTALCCWLKRRPRSPCRPCSLRHTPEGMNLDWSWFGIDWFGRTQTGRWMCRSPSPTLWHSSCVQWNPVSHFPVWGTGSRTPLPAGVSWWSGLCGCQPWWFHSWKWGSPHPPAE